LSNGFLHPAKDTMSNHANAIPMTKLPIWFSRDFIEALPTGVYICDANSVVVAYNSRAAEIWGRKPEPGDSQHRFCGAHRLYLADGTFVPHDQTPIATVPLTGLPSGVFEAIVEREDGTRRNVLASVAPLFDDEGVYIGFVNCVQDVTDTKDSRRRETGVRDALAVAKRSLRENDRTLVALGRVNADLVENAQFLKGILDSVSDCIEVLDTEGRIQFMNHEGLRAMEINDFDEVRGADWAKDYCGEQVEAAQAAIAMAKAGGIGRFETFAPTLKGNMLWWDVTVTQIADEGSNIGTLLAISRDITEKKQIEDERKLLGQELQHRLKNTIAMVQAIANQSLRSASSLEEARTVLGNRIAILSKAHDILLSEDGNSADLVSIVGAMVDLHADRRERFLVEGVNINFGAKAAMAMALSLHELATNAQKYGALSNDSGSVAINWQLKDEHTLTFRWAETDGPPVETPTSKGFGSRLTQVMLPVSIGGTPVVSYDPSGFVFEVVADIRTIQAD
jgi:PAS domain S-box-containing protein